MPISAEEIAQAAREYHPCVGLHVCGWNAEDRPLTIANVPGISREAFDRAKEQFALPDGEDFDLLVDLYVDEHTYTEQFAIRRQSLDALLRAVT